MTWYSTGNNELYHYGIPKMRWGFRRFQNYDGSLTDEGRIRYGHKLRSDSGILGKFKKNKEAKEKQKKLEKARQARAQKKAYKEGRERAIKSGSAEDALRYKDDLSIEEKKAIYNRLLADNDLLRLAKSEREYKAEVAKSKSLGTKLSKVVDVLDKTATMATKVQNAYNTGAKIYNTFSENKLPVIGEKKEVDYYKSSKAMAKDLEKKFKNMSMNELNDELNRLSALRTIEDYNAGNGKWVIRNTPNPTKQNPEPPKQTENKKEEPKKETSKKEESGKEVVKKNSSTHKVDWINSDYNDTLDLFDDRKKKKK